MAEGTKEAGAIDAPAGKGQTLVLFGNPSPQMQVTHPDGSATTSTPAKHINQSVTRVEMSPDFDDKEFVALTLSTDNDRVLTMISRTLATEDKHYAVGLNELEQIVSVHSGGSTPSWISSSDPEFQRVAAAHFACAEGEPIALLTTAGRDALHAQHLSTSAPPATFNFMAVTESVVAPAVGDTTLTGEVTTAGGGLLRIQATYAHTAGTNTSTLTKTFTANGSDVLPKVLTQIGIFNAVTVGTLGYHTALSSSATLTTSGDNATITWTDTAG